MNRSCRSQQARPQRRLLVATLLSRSVEIRAKRELHEYTFICTTAAPDLVSAVRTNDLSLVLTEPWDARGVPTSATVRWLKSTYPSLPAIACCSRETAVERETLCLVRAGVDSIVLCGIDDRPRMLRDAVEEAVRGCVENEVMRAVRPYLGPTAAALMHHWLMQHSTTVSVQQVAEALGIDRKTVLNRLARERMPTPRDIRALGTHLHCGAVARGPWTLG